MTTFKLGRLPAVHTLRTFRAGLALARSLTPLGAPPAVSDDWTAAVAKQAPSGWGMYLNEQLGCCVCADTAHQIMLHTANAGTIVIPTDNDVLTNYEAVGGYVPGNPATDRGCDETSECAYLENTGMAGQKSAGTAMIDPANLDHIRWAVQLFGACRLGITVTDQMMSDFQSGTPWTSMAGNVEGGHDVPIVRYDATFAWVVTWARLQPVSWGLLAQSACLQEAHAEVWPDFCSASGAAPNGLNLQALLADLPAVD